MQVAPFGGQICSCCKWRLLVANFATKERLQKKTGLSGNMIWIFSFLLLQMFLTEKDKVVVVTRIVYFSERAFVLGFLGPQRALK